MREIKSREIKKLFWSRNLKLILTGIFLIEIFSFLSFYFEPLRPVIFLGLAIAFLLVCLYRFEFGVYIALVEIFIGSLGALFFWEVAGIGFSIRMVLWIILLAVWGVKYLPKIKKAKIFSSGYLYFLIPLLVLVAWGLLSGFLNKHSLPNIFFDFNGWLYFALILPLYEVILKRKNSFLVFLQLLFASAIWLSLKTFALLFIFSHNLNDLMSVVYDWIRDTGVGEITQMPDTFTRIFFQSHIFVLLAFFLVLFVLNNYLEKRKANWKKLLLPFLTLISFQAVVLLSFSRSFWLGAFCGTLVLLGLISWRYGFKRAALNLGVIFLSGVLGLALLTLIVKIPILDSTARFNTADSLKDRAKSFSNEAAVSSRWALLPKLWGEIKETPVLGQGFGTTITYESSDPRVLEETPNGKYTTYAFEWGWLDIWLKLGLLGLILYLALLIKIIIDSWYSRSLKKSSLSAFLITGLIIISVINFFTPYLNHPLGIGYLIFSLGLIDKLD